ncbi:MAG: ADP-ribosylation factor-like protein [Candidatus Helarchaeota archaeon]
MSQKFFKILFLGLDNAGKTSFLLSLENKYSQLHSLRPTKGLFKYDYKILGFSTSLLDFGGQRIYRDEFFKKKENYLATDLLFFIVDVQDRSRFAENGEFFEKLLKEFEENNVNPEIVICFHKCDPDLMVDEESYLHTNIKIAERLFRTRAGWRELDFYRTTIYDYSSLIRAFSAGLLKIFKTFASVMKTIFNDFVTKTNVSGLCLLDQDALILHEYTDNKKQTKDILEIVGSNMSQMNEKLVKYEYGYPEYIEIKLKGWSYFKTFELETSKKDEKRRFHIIIYSEQIDNFEIINELLPNFTTVVSDTLRTFLKE